MIDLLNQKNLDEVLASILFVAGIGIEKKELIEKLEISKEDLDDAIEKLKKKYSGKSGIHFKSYGDKIQLSSNPNYADCISTVLQKIKEKQLTKKAMEVMAIIAYKQPITKLEIEQIRGGVSSDYSIQVLLEKKLIDIVGRKDAVGLPFLYGTTDEFLKRFELQSLSDLPSYESVLERIRVVHREDNSLYRQFDIPSDEEESDEVDGVPTFLDDEEHIVSIQAEDIE